MCQIKYIIRFLLLWIIFQVTAAATKDSCSFKISADSSIIENITKDASATFSGITNTEQCGQKCCNMQNCSAALFRNNVCLLIDCDKIGGGCTYGVHEGISSISVTREMGKESTDGENGENGKEKSRTDNLSKPVASSAPSPTAGTTNQADTTATTVPPKDDSGVETESGSVADATQARESTQTTVIDMQTTPQNSENSTHVPTIGATVKPTEEALTQSGEPLTGSPSKPTTTNPTIAVGQTILSVTTGGNQQIRIPKDSVTIHADVSPQSDNKYDYHWRLIKQLSEDFLGTESGIETDTLKLAALTQGDYEFKVEVKGKNAYGEAFVNVTVLPKLRVNKPPVAVISPPFQELTLPTDSTLLDGSKSHDDDGIELYEWEEVEGPLQANINKDENGNLPDEKVLKITGLVVGSYTFKLTVTDTDKVANSTLARIIVKKKIDNPPIANAGSNQVIHMPQNSATLCGNDSTDDWGIAQYKWSLASDSKKDVVDMQGARTKCIQVSNLEAGDYTFQLTVTDDAGQEDTARVMLIVQPESNHPPVANAGKDQQLLLPIDNGAVTANLDGTESSADKQITTIIWKMTSGPQSVIIVEASLLKTSVTGITKPGEYILGLTITDEDGASSSDSVVITVKEEQPPVAVAGPDITLTLPDNVAMLDGSKSTDDYGITEYKWSRTGKSPAAGHVLNHSDHQSVLHVAGLVQGMYTFVLKVTNVRGKSTEDTAKITVMPDSLTDKLVELHLDANILTFDKEHKATVIKQLEVLLSLQSEDTIIVRDVFAEHGTGHLIVLFYVQPSDGNFLPAMEVADSLNSKLTSDVKFLEFKFFRADTYVCENLCSGHGRCHSGSHECECDVFWMENFLRVLIGDGKRNCDWSVLYAGIVVFILITVVCCFTWFLACYCLRRRGKTSTHKRRKNNTTHDKARYEKLPMKPHRNGNVRKNGYVRPTVAYKSSSIMRSISSSSSSLDSDDAKESTLFERKRLLVTNGGGRFNGAFDLDANLAKLPVRKSSSSSSRNSNKLNFREKRDDNFGHQSTILKVEDNSEEELI